MCSIFCSFEGFDSYDFVDISISLSVKLGMLSLYQYFLFPNKLKPEEELLSSSIIQLYFV
jgi:hypothetical protein